MNDEKIIEKLLEHDEKLAEITNNMLTKEDGNRIITTLDNIAHTVKKIDEDHTFGVEWMKRLQKEVEDQQKTIDDHEELLQKIKLELKIA